MALRLIAPAYTVPHCPTCITSLIAVLFVVIDREQSATNLIRLNYPERWVMIVGAETHDQMVVGCMPS